MMSFEGRHCYFDIVDIKNDMFAFFLMGYLYQMLDFEITSLTFNVIEHRTF